MKHFKGIDTRVAWIIVLVLVIAAGFLGYYLLGKNDNQSAVRVMEGVVVEVGDQFVVVEGRVGEETRTIRFNVTPLTVLTNRKLVITEEQLKSGEQFFPRTDEVSGSFDDLALNTLVATVTSRDNLFRIEETDAVEIKYSSFDSPSIR